MLSRLFGMAFESSPKRLKTTSIIATHNGHFHADEALAVYLLRQLPAYATSTLLRTRDPTKLSTASIVVDVGGEYDASKDLFDHHQRTFDTCFPDRRTKLSSAGLVYLHFGKQILAPKVNDTPESPTTKLIWDKLYKDFIEAIDANDNGISVYDPKALEAAELKRRFNDNGVSLSSLVGDLNPDWTEGGLSQEEEDRRFVVASEFMGAAFENKVKSWTKSWLPARQLVRQAFGERSQYDGAGRVMVLKQGMPWKDHLFACEQDAGKAGEVIYALYPEKPQDPSSRWRIQAVPVAPDAFESRQPLPEAWRGVRDEKLSEAIGIPGSIFVHASGFIGGNLTFDGVLQMAEKALSLNSQKS